jgi:hypothetical protein
MWKAILATSFPRPSFTYRFCAAVGRADFLKALVNAFCHSASVHNGFLCGRLCSILIPNRIPASNALIISFDGGIHFVFVRIAISASSRQV